MSSIFTPYQATDYYLEKIDRILSLGEEDHEEPFDWIRETSLCVLTDRFRGLMKELKPNHVKLVEEKSRVFSTHGTNKFMVI